MGLVFGLIYWRQPLSQLSIGNINGALFLMLTQMTFGFCFNVIMVDQYGVSRPGLAVGEVCG